MSRIGQNPLKTQEQTIKLPSQVTVGILNYIPEQIGYFQGQFDSLKLCLASIRHHAEQPIDILVVDNGSCAEIRSYLQEELASGNIDYLILNRRNIGKANGVLQILHSAPGDLVFYSDGDIYYKPGWVKAHLDIMAAFSNVGLVGGVPLRNLANYYTVGTLRWVDENRGKLFSEKGDLIPEAWTCEFMRSINQEKSIKNWLYLEDCRITNNGITAYVGASHMQYLMSRQVIQQLPHRRFGLALNTLDDQVFDRAVEEAGLLRLSTERPYVYHIGNTITEDWLAEEFKRLVGGPVPQQVNPKIRQKRHWFWGRWSVRCLLRQIHEWTFERYYQNT